MNPNDEIFKALTPEQRLKVMMAEAFARFRKQEPEVETEVEPKDPKGWSQAQLLGFKRVLSGEEPLPTWVAALIITRAWAACEEGSALRNFDSPEPKRYEFRVHVGFGRWADDPLEEDQTRPVAMTGGHWKTKHFWSHTDKEWKLTQVYEPHVVWVDAPRPSLDHPVVLSKQRKPDAGTETE